jgi:hypothetical protein
MSPRAQKRRPQPDPSPLPESPDEGFTETDLLPEPENGHTELETAEPQVEEPAKMKVQIEGTASAVRGAARKIANAPAPPPSAAPSADAEPPDDTDALLADGHNMVVVRRTFPKSVEMRDGTKRRCATKLPDRYDCPTTRDKIEADVFDRFGGSEYKCTIHPATTNGESQVLGFFTIEHPNPSEPPYFPDDPPEESFDPRTSIAADGQDPTARETDGLAKLRADAERRLERARVRKEMKELEAEAKRLEEEIDGVDRKPPAPVAPVGESDEVRKLREENERLRREAEAKKNDDRFAAMQNSIADLAKSVAALAAGGGKPHGGEESLAIKMLTQSQQHSKDMLELVKSTSSKPTPSGEGDFDKFLDRMAKLNAITGGGPNKGRGLSQLEEKLIDMSFERLTGGADDDGGGDGEDDVAKLAIKEFAPIAKTFVEKKMNEAEAASGGSPLTPEQLKKIQLEAAQAAAKKVQEDLALQGLGLATGQDGRLIAVHIQKPTKQTVVPPRQPGSRVVSEQRTAGGVVKKVAIEPADLSERPRTAATAPNASQPEQNKGDEANMPKCGVFPMLGPNGTEIKIPFPARPGELKYDRKYAVDFILDGIRSEIRQGFPQKSETDKRIESYVIGDAMEYLDDEILDQLDGVDTGAKLEALLGPWGEASKIAEIKKAGDDEIVSGYLRKLVLSIQREWQREKAAPQS